MASPPDSVIGPDLGALAASEIDRARVCFGWRGGRLHAGVHQGRKAIRRARAILALGSPVLGAGAAWVDACLRDACRGQSGLRDAHALVGILSTLRARAPSGVAPVFLRLERCARQLRADAAREADLRPAREHLGAARGALAALPWERVDVACVVAAAGALQDRARKLGRRAGKRGRDVDWHAWRRTIRRCSQQARAVHRLGVDDAWPELAGIEAAAALGELQDFSLLLDHLGRARPLTACISRDERRAVRGWLREERGRRREALLEAARDAATVGTS